MYYTVVTEMHTGCQLAYNSNEDFLHAILQCTGYHALLKWGKKCSQAEEFATKPRHTAII